jgi:hypothetical protein
VKPNAPGRIGRLALWIGLSSALASCLISVQRSDLPDYGKPRMLTLSPDETVLADVVRYRPLPRADFRASSRTEATLGVQQQIDSAVRNTTTAVVEINTRFDRDTSATHAPRKQAEWLARVEAELRRLPAGSQRPVERDHQPHSDSSWEPL